VEIQSNYLEFEGREYSCCFVVDISERKKAEESLRESEKKFRVLSETSPTAVLLYQGEKIVYANQATERLFGYDADELLRMNFWDWVHEDFKVAVRERGLKRLNGEPVPTRYESKFVTKEGEERWLAVSAGLVEYRGRPAGIASLLDITESKRSEELLRGTLAEKTILLKEVHHRVKNNLQIISALLDLQSESIHDEQSRICFQYSQDRIRSMALVHEHLYRSRDFASIDFADYIENLAAYLFNSYRSDLGRISLKVNADNIVLGIDMSIPCGLIINELISNSLKHAFPDDRQGEVTIELSAGTDGWINLSVADTGVGFPSGIDIANVRTLGLRIVGMLVKQVRGRIEMRNDNGAYCMVRFRDAMTE
jgi:PAS domain S-box-containing protein